MKDIIPQLGPQLKFNHHFEKWKKKVSLQPKTSLYRVVYICGKMFGCCKCVKSFESSVDLWNHLKIHNINTKTRTKLVCHVRECFKTFYHGYSYKRHLEQDHSIVLHVTASDADSDENTFYDESNLEQAEVLPNEKTTEEISSNIKHSVSEYVAKLKSSSLPSSTVQRIICDTRELLRNVVEAVEQVSAPVIEDIAQEIQPSNDKIGSLQSVIHMVKDPFEYFSLSTEHKQNQFARNCKVLIEPEEIVFGNVYKESLNTHTGRTEQKQVEETFQYVPIGENLKVYLEQPGYMSAIIQEKDSAGEKDVLQTYREGSYYKTCEGKEDCLDIELLLYNDDFETANPLGSKKGKHKLLGIYATVASLPKKYQAKLENVLLVVLAKSSLVSKYGVNVVLQLISDDLEVLFTEGLLINSPDGFTGRVRPRLLQAVGDNLALNTILGFSASFSANYYCRFCKSPKANCRKQVAVDERLLRTKENIDYDISLNDLSQTGLRRSCALNSLSYYHVSENYAPDLMHDFLEGLLPFEMKLVVSELIHQENFSLDELNSRIQSFSYGITEQANKPSLILQSHVSNPFGPSGQKASQMSCLVEFFPLIVGDKVEEGCEYWRLFTILLEIYQLVIAPNISIAATYYLQSRICEHHQLYLQLFPDHHLLPKHHNLLHYPRAMRQLGPLSQYSCMRQEGKHKPLKKWARTCNNYKNIAKTIAHKHQEAQAFRILQKENINSECVCIHSSEFVKVCDLDSEAEVCQLLGCERDAEIELCDKVTFYGYTYRPNVMLLTEWCGEQPSFSRIDFIVRRQNRLHLMIQPWKTNCFHDHFQAFAASEDELATLKLLDPEDLFEHRPVHAVKSHRVADHKWYIPTRYMLS